MMQYNTFLGTLLSAKKLTCLQFSIDLPVIFVFLVPCGTSRRCHKARRRVRPNGLLKRQHAIVKRPQFLIPWVMVLFGSIWDEIFHDISCYFKPRLGWFLHDALFADYVASCCRFLLMDVDGIMIHCLLWFLPGSFCDVAALVDGRMYAISSYKHP